ncbi:DinB family protein [Maribacter sp. 2210JD10-5]|uniref:DinB family protein n=1 Tax=Maribacter sp. 2210JD10-5 TaxID=3386272 RepID=UPI0039BCFDD1
MKVSDLAPTEFAHFYATYLNVLDDVALMDALKDGKKWFQDFVNNLPEEKLSHNYQEGKWTIAEVLLHLIDTERVFQYRAFRFSRNDMTPLPGFDQDDFVAECESERRNKESILEEYLSVRNATITLFETMDDTKLKRIGTASDMPWSVAALGLVISGHQKHHTNILLERYL